MNPRHNNNNTTTTSNAFNKTNKLTQSDLKEIEQYEEDDAYCECDEDIFDDEEEYKEEIKQDQYQQDWNDIIYDKFDLIIKGIANNNPLNK